MSLRKLKEKKRERAKTTTNRTLFEELKQDGSLLRCKHIPETDSYECVIHKQEHRSWVPWKLVKGWIKNRKVGIWRGTNDILYGILIE